MLVHICVSLMALCVSTRESHVTQFDCDAHTPAHARTLRVKRRFLIFIYFPRCMPKIEGLILHMNMNGWILVPVMYMNMYGWMSMPFMYTYIDIYTYIYIYIYNIDYNRHWHHKVKLHAWHHNVQILHSKFQRQIVCRTHSVTSWSLTASVTLQGRDMYADLGAALLATAFSIDKLVHEHVLFLHPCASHARVYVQTITRVESRCAAHRLNALWSLSQMLAMSTISERDVPASLRPTCLGFVYRCECKRLLKCHPRRFTPVNGSLEHECTIASHSHA